jgi:hypothetical protein
LIEIAEALPIGGAIEYKGLRTTLQLGPRDQRFSLALMAATRELEERGIFMLRKGKQWTRLSPDDAARILTTRRGRHIVNKAKRGIGQAQNILESPDLDERGRMLATGAIARDVAVSISAGMQRRALPKISEPTRIDVQRMLAARGPTTH